MEVLSIAILKSLTPKDVETVFYDERLAPIPYEETTDLVAITVETFTARRAYQIAEKYRQRGVKVVMGGFHPTLMPEESLCFSDAVVQGDAENIWPQVIQDAKKGQLRRLYQHKMMPSFAGTLPDHSIFKGMKYAPLTLLQFGRGCHYNCSFCSIRAFYGSCVRHRPVDDIIFEIESTGANHLLFVDDNICADVSKAKELFQALIPLRVTWSCQVSIDITKSQELLNLMQKSGCMSALIGFESLNHSNLESMNKGWNLKWSDYDTSIKKLQDAGIMIYGTFVFGWDYDTPVVFDEAVEFAISHKFILAGFNPLMPMPGTRTYDNLKKEGRLIFERWWIDPDYRYGEATFHPKSMTAEEFTNGCYRARTMFSTYSSIFQRLFDRRTNMRSFYRTWAYIVSNYMLRQEIHEKQGKSLGESSDKDPYFKIPDFSIDHLKHRQQNQDIRA